MRKLLMLTALLSWAGLVLIGPNRAADPQYLPDALKYLKSDKSTDRSFALATMGLMGGDAKSASKEIVNAFFDSSPDVRKAANLCLKNVNPPLYAPVVNLVQGDNYEARLNAVLQLSKLGKDAAPTLNAILRFFPDARPTDQARIVDAVAEVGKDDKAMTAQMAAWALRDANPAVRDAALKALPKMADPGSQAGLFLGAAQQGQPAANRIRALGILALIAPKNDMQLMKTIAGMETDPDPQVRAAAKKALGDIKARK